MKSNKPDQSTLRNEPTAQDQDNLKVARMIMRAMRLLLGESPFWIEVFFPMGWLKNDPAQELIASWLYSQHVRTLSSGDMKESALYGLGYALAHVSKLPDDQRLAAITRYLDEADRQFPERLLAEF